MRCFYQTFHIEAQRSVLCSALCIPTCLLGSLHKDETSGPVVRGQRPRVAHVQFYHLQCDEEDTNIEVVVKCILFYIVNIIYICAFILNTDILYYYYYGDGDDYYHHYHQGPVCFSFPCCYQHICAIFEYNSVPNNFLELFRC